MEQPAFVAMNLGSAPATIVYSQNTPCGAQRGKGCLRLMSSIILSGHGLPGRALEGDLTLQYHLVKGET
jgi:hypothetical protein